MNGSDAGPQIVDRTASLRLLHVAAILAKERITPAWDFIMSSLGSTVLLIAQFAFLRGLDPSGDALRYLALARTAYAFSGGQHLERFLIDGYMSGSLMMDVITPINPLAFIVARSFAGMLASAAATLPGVLVAALLLGRMPGMSWPGVALKQGEAAVQLRVFITQLASGALMRAAFRRNRLSAAGFWIWFVSVGLYQLLGLAFVWVASSRLSAGAEWLATYVYGIFQGATGLAYAFGAWTVFFASRYVRRGELDALLLLAPDPRVSLPFADFEPVELMGALSGYAIALIGLHAGARLTVPNAALTLTGIACGGAATYSLFMAAATLSALCQAVVGCDKLRHGSRLVRPVSHEPVPQRHEDTLHMGHPHRADRQRPGPPDRRRPGPACRRIRRSSGRLCGSKSPVQASTRQVHRALVSFWSVRRRTRSSRLTLPRPARTMSAPRLISSATDTPSALAIARKPSICSSVSSTCIRIIRIPAQQSPPL